MNVQSLPGARLSPPTAPRSCPTTPPPGVPRAVADEDQGPPCPGADPQRPCGRAANLNASEAQLRCVNLRLRQLEKLVPDPSQDRRPWPGVTAALQRLHGSRARLAKRVARLRHDVQGGLERAETMADRSAARVLAQGLRDQLRPEDATLAARHLDPNRAVTLLVPGA
jgi:hypothetical protein